MAALLLLLWGGAGPAAAKRAAAARKHDVPFIRCEVCEEVVKNLNRQVARKRDEKALKKLTELEIIEVTESICDVTKEEGDWIQWLDIEEEKDRLKLVEQSLVGECNSVCKTIQKACQEVMGDHDTDVAEFLYSGESKRAALSQLLCRTLSQACVGKAPPLPKGREPGEAFVAKDEKKVEMDRIMRSMEGMPGGGRGMKMYHRDDLMKGIPGMGGFGGGDGEEDEDEEDEEEEEEGRRGSGASPRATAGQGQRGGGALPPAAELAASARDGATRALGVAKEASRQAYRVAAERAAAATWWLGGLFTRGRKEGRNEPGKGGEL